jgi:hypothetical protein
MRLRAAIITTLATLGFAAGAWAVPPTRITIVSVFDPITFGDNDYVNGQVFDVPAGQVVQLEQSAAPFTEWTPVAQATTDPVGYYSFKLHPTQTLHYRTSSEGVLSERVVKISVAPRVSFKAGAAGRSSVRFTGAIAPALPGQRILIQRRGAGGWRTAGSAVLRNGKTFSGRIRVSRTSLLRAFIARDGAHRDGSSHAVTVRF